MLRKRQSTLQVFLFSVVDWIMTTIEAQKGISRKKNTNNNYNIYKINNFIIFTIYIPFICKKSLRISFSRRLVPVHYREFNYCLMEIAMCPMRKSLTTLTCH